MAYENLSDFINELHDDGELVRIRAEVDPVLEIAEIAARLNQSPGGSPALFFERVRGSSLPVVVNLLGSERRLCRALQVGSWTDIAERMVEVIRPQVPEGWLEKLKLAPQLTPQAKLLPRNVRNGACQQVVKLGRDVDLGELPVLQCWPHDTGRVITAGQVFTKNPETGERCLGRQRVQVRDRNSALLQWHPHDAAWQNWHAYRHAGQQMPVAIALGGDPVFACLATAPLPPHSDPCLFGGSLRGQGIDLVKCRTIDQDVPAGAEIIIEGYIDPSAAWETGGACGDSTGFYSPAAEFPVLHVTAITHRANPIYPSVLLGRSVLEEYWLSKASERLFLPLLQMFVPEVLDYNFPRAGGARNVCFVRMRKTYPQQARKVLNAIWSLDQTMCAKIVVVVDEQVNVQDEQDVWFHVGANVHPGRDVVFHEGPTHALDHAAPLSGVGHKMGIDATRKWPEEGHPRPWPDELTMPHEIRELVSQRWSQYGL